MVPSALLSWSSIRDYCWLKPTQLELRIHSTILRAISYVRVQVRAADHDQLQAILQDWLMEKPAEGDGNDYSDLEQ